MNVPSKSSRNAVISNERQKDILEVKGNTHAHTLIYSMAREIGWKKTENCSKNDDGDNDDNKKIKAQQT